MVHSDDENAMRSLIDLVHDAVRAASRRMQSLELAAKRMPDSEWVLKERTEEELHDRCRGLLRQAG